MVISPLPLPRLRYVSAVFPKIESHRAKREATATAHRAARRPRRAIKYTKYQGGSRLTDGLDSQRVASARGEL